MPGGPFGDGSSARDQHPLQTWRIALVRIVGVSRARQRNSRRFAYPTKYSANDWPLKVRVSLNDCDRSRLDDRARRRQGAGCAHESDGPEAQHRPGGRNGGQGDRKAIEKGVDPRRDRPAPCAGGPHIRMTPRCRLRASVAI